MICPRCLRSNSYMRLRTNTAICRACGKEWKPTKEEKEVEKGEKSKG